MDQQHPLLPSSIYPSFPPSFPPSLCLSVSPFCPHPPFTFSSPSQCVSAPGPFLPYHFSLPLLPLPLILLTSRPDPWLLLLCYSSRPHQLQTWCAHGGTAGKACSSTKYKRNVASVYSVLSVSFPAKKIISLPQNVFCFQFNSLNWI